MTHRQLIKKIMSTSGLIITLCIISTLTQAEVLPNVKWQNALKPKGQAAEALTLASNGATNYAIVLPQKPTSQDQKAAQDLCKWLKIMTGVNFPIVTENTATKAETKIISIGKTSFASDVGFKDDNLGNEGYAIEVKDKNLFLLGGKMRGPINAVYALLEEDLGCRWYRRNTATIPHMKTLQFHPVPRRFVPKLEIRDSEFIVARDSVWSLRNRTMPTVYTVTSEARVPAEYGGSMEYAELYCHTFFRLVPKTLFKTHPEYFSENDGKRNTHQICVSNPDVLKLVIAGVKGQLKRNPRAKFVSVSQEDGFPFCDCKECKKITDVEGSAAGPLIVFINKIADAIAKDYPNVKVSTLAYMDTTMPPKTIKPRDNVVIVLCMPPRPFQTQEQQEEAKALAKGWESLGAYIHYWDYVSNYHHSLVPIPNMQVVASNIRFFCKHNAKGVFHNTTGFGTADELMKSWVWAKQMWDPSRDTKALIRDFVYGYFGTSAVPVMEYQNLLWDTWEKKKDRLKDYDPIFPLENPMYTKEFIKKSLALFAKARKLASNEETLHRVERAELPVQYIYLVLLVKNKPENPSQLKQFYTILDKFEKVANREKITHLNHWTTIKSLIASWRKGVSLKPNESRKFLARIGIEMRKAHVLRIPAYWKFSLDENNKGVDNKYFSSDFNDNNWGKCRTDLGYGWEKQGFSKKSPMYGWYRQKLKLPDGITGKYLYLYFSAVDEDAYIYINGAEVLDHSCKATGLTPAKIYDAPFMLDVTKMLKRDKENLIAVRVYNRVGMGGIWKPVYVISSNTKMSLADLKCAIEQEQ